MIYYDSNNFLASIYVYAGTVWPSILKRFILISIYIFVSYYFEASRSVVLGTEGRTVFLSTLSFLLIFRANQAYSRYDEGRDVVAQFFSDLREFMMLSILSARGGIANASMGVESAQRLHRHHESLEDAFDKRARELRVDIIRLGVALAVSFKLHTRICLEGYCFGAISKETKWRVDWDRLRLRQLLTDEEFDAVETSLAIDERHEGPTTTRSLMRRLLAQFEGPLSYSGPQEPPDEWPAKLEVSCASGIRCPVIIGFFLRERIFMHLNEFINTQPWGIKERYAAALTKLITSMLYNYEYVNQIITTPIPLPLASLCKTLLVLFFASMPMFLDYHEGLFANTLLPVMVSLAMLGIDAIATEIENPFGDDSNDLDLLEQIHMLENEAMELLLLCGDHEGRDRFYWRRLPPFIRKSSSRKLMRQLVVKDFAGPEVADYAPNDSLCSEDSSEALAKSLGSSSNLFGSLIEAEE